MQVINYHEESVKEVLKKEYKKVASSPCWLLMLSSLKYM